MSTDPITPTPDSPFAHGPYTTLYPTNPSNAPDSPDSPTAGELPAIPRRDVRTLVIIALGILFFGCFIGAWGWGEATEPPPERKSLPICELEDGSTQKVCIFPGDRGPIVNMEYGRYTYDVTNNRLYDYGKEQRKP